MFFQYKRSKNMKKVIYVKTYCYVITFPEAKLRVVKKEGWLQSAKHEKLCKHCCVVRVWAAVKPPVLKRSKNMKIGIAVIHKSA